MSIATFSAQFVEHPVKAFSCPIEYIQTDNGKKELSKYKKPASLAETPNYPEYEI